MPRFEDGLFDNECKHGIFPKYACGDCKPKPKVIKAKRKGDAAEPADKPIIPKCKFCGRKARKSLGHTNHRTYVKLTSAHVVHGRNPERTIGYEQKRAVFDATHQDDKGNWTCDECCQRCTRCKSNTVAPGKVAADVRFERVSVSERALSERHPMSMQLTGESTRGDT